MTSKTLDKKIHMLDRDVTLLRSAVVGVIGEKDPEGEYRPEFVASVLKAVSDKGRGMTFTGSANFLSLLKKA